MTDDRKREWERPEARPVTEVDSRADVQDVPVTNQISGPN